MHARFPPKKSPWKTQNLNKKKIYTENIISEYTENLKKKKFRLISRIDMKKNKAFTISIDPIK